MTDGQITNCGQHGTQWTADELAKINVFAYRMARKPELLAAFPGRTVGAIKMQVVMARKRLGLIQQRNEKFLAKQREDYEPHMLDKDDPGLPCNYPKRWATEASKSNARFLAALAA